MLRSLARHQHLRALSTAAQKASSQAGPAIQVSCLPNNVFVATKGGEQELVSFSVSLVAGSRYETSTAPGIADFFKHSLFLSNRQESSIALTRLQEIRGAQLSVDLSRNLLSITGHCPRDTLVDVMESVGYMIHPRKMESHEMELIRKKVQFERSLFFSNPKNFLLEKVQEVAWRRGYGQSVVCPAEYESKITPEKLSDYFLRTFTHQGTSAVAVGVEHEVFSRLVPKVFEDIHFAKFGTMGFMPPEYYGGEARLETAGDNICTIAFPVRGGNESATGLATALLMGKLYIPTASVQYGSQTSLLLAKSPFKGIGQVSGNLQVYSEDSLVSFTLEGGNGKDMREALKRITLAGKEGVPDEALNKAKSQVIFELRQSWDSRTGFLAAAREQLVATGTVFNLADIQKAVQSVTLEQISATAGKTFSAKPALVAFGNLYELPYLDQLRE